MDAHLIYVMLLSALVLFGVYRRFRRNFGRQPLQPKRMLFRVVLLSAIGIALLAASAHNLKLMSAADAGLGIGAVLAMLGLRLTRFETGAEGSFYTPNSYIGAILSAVFLARLLYRFVALAPAVHQAYRDSDANPFASVSRSPLTTGIFMVLIAYYVIYYAALLVRARKLTVASP